MGSLNQSLKLGIRQTSVVLSNPDLIASDDYTEMKNIVLKVLE